ncbi:MAG TPA: MBOAT family O-acyltransferase [Saprospiraceae bacterium]|nr:MBOAT family O-acyltransferase [Saprospiraceae bacterium]
MLFNSFAFLVFLPIVFLIYWRIRNLRVQNFFVIVASYVFYGWWDWRFLSLIIFSSLADYLLGLRLQQAEDLHRRKRWLWCSLIVNLGLLGTFKYFNFFIDSAALLLESLGFQAHLPTLRIVLPVGISFYTFQSLSYTIDIYRRKLEPTRDMIAFFAFVSFFPQLVAGPIERAQHLLPQFLKSRRFEEQLATDGLRQMLWGFFKKVVIADNCAIIADICFDPSQSLTWWSYLVGIIFFAFQIYGDFSGYSDIAIGLARLFGFQLMRNFAYPYFSRDMAEFWRRWHISLSTWFRDYVYISLGGSHGSMWKRIRNIIITFTVSGLWHGANWTYIFWGFLNGLYYIPLMLANQHKAHTEIVARNTFLPSPKELGQILITFLLTCLAWVFFRARDMHSAIVYLQHMSGIHDGTKSIIKVDKLTLEICSAGLLILVTFEWLQRKKAHALERLPLPTVCRWLLYIIIGFLVISFFETPKTFIYFQF